MPNPRLSQDSNTRITQAGNARVTAALFNARITQDSNTRITQAGNARVVMVAWLLSISPAERQSRPLGVGKMAIGLR